MFTIILKYTVVVIYTIYCWYNQSVSVRNATPYPVLLLCESSFAVQTDWCIPPWPLQIQLLTACKQTIWVEHCVTHLQGRYDSHRHVTFCGPLSLGFLLGHELVATHCSPSTIGHAARSASSQPCWQQQRICLLVWYHGRNSLHASLDSSCWTERAVPGLVASHSCQRP